jgi:RHS repeat-associated protein
VTSYESTVAYTYDSGNRMTQPLGFSYDNINRRSTLTLSNGVNVSYTYDNDSRVTGITYKFNANTLGNLTYSYDSLGRRTQVGGSFAQTSLPGAVTSATYDAANELTNWNGTSVAYDSNGNMLSDGSNAFTWNARNQVATLNSVSLQYDGFGRRTKNLQNTSFLFDGANAVQELSGSTATGNLINGGIDEIFIRTDSTGSFTPLKDALGSTIALVDATGNLATQYFYDPFGNTTISGTNNVNEFQYTGRENEGNGLYYMRARYYSPVLHRFINPDPARFLADINFYRYCYDSPTNCADRFGLLGGGPEEDEEPSTPRPNTAPEDMPARLVLGNDVVDASERLDEMEEEAEAEARATDPLSKLSPAEQWQSRVVHVRRTRRSPGPSNSGNYFTERARPT